MACNSTKLDLDIFEKPKVNLPTPGLEKINVKEFLAAPGIGIDSRFDSGYVNNRNISWGKTRDFYD